jgi:3-hydroxybutyryl-CoA dehydratase
MSFFRDELGMSFDKLTIGQKATFSRRVTKQDVLQYMSLSGDLNPLYGDATYAGRTTYGHPIVPANMLAGFAMGAVASVLPGLGSLTHAHSYRLSQPPQIGDEVTIEMEVAALKPDEKRVVIAYSMRDQTGRELLEGTMEVEPPQVLRPALRHEYESF